MIEASVAPSISKYHQTYESANVISPSSTSMNHWIMPTLKSHLNPKPKREHRIYKLLSNAPSTSMKLLGEANILQPTTESNTRPMNMEA